MYGMVGRSNSENVLRAHRQTGQNIVELALGIGFLIVMVLGMVDFGRVFYAHAGLTNAAREGARRATLLTDCTGANLTDIQNRVIAEQPALAITNSMITVDCSQSDRRTVSIAYAIELANPFLGPLVGYLAPDNTWRVRLSTWATLPVMS
jgi:Flp pilus assembly protein TadG